MQGEQRPLAATAAAAAAVQVYVECFDAVYSLAVVPCSLPST